MIGAAVTAGWIALPGARLQSVAAQDSTPEADGPQALAMLRFVPIEIFEAADDNPILATVADIAARTESSGIDRPTSQDDDPAFGDWIQATQGLALPSPFARAFTPEWLATFGWDGFQADQTLEFGLPPDNAQVYIGRFDQDTIDDALLANDFNVVEVEGAAAAWSLSPEGDLDLDSDVGRLALGGMNNVVLMPDGVLITARTLDTATLLAETAAGERDTLAGNEFVQALLEAQSTPLDSAMLLAGTALAGTIDAAAILVDETDDDDSSGQSALDRTADRIATQIAEQAQSGMPPILLALAGTTGETPISRACYTLLLASEEDAEAAVPVIEERLETGVSVATQEPWSDLFSGWTVGAVADAPVVTVELETERPALWFNLIFQRDTGFLAW